MSKRYLVYSPTNFSTAAIISKCKIQTQSVKMWFWSLGWKIEFDKILNHLLASDSISEMHESDKRQVTLFWLNYLKSVIYFLTVNFSKAFVHMKVRLVTPGAISRIKNLTFLSILPGSIKSWWRHDWTPQRHLKLQLLCLQMFPRSRTVCLKCRFKICSPAIKNSPFLKQQSLNSLLFVCVYFIFA